MPDSFTDTSSQSWLGRIGGSIVGFFIGFILLAAAVWLLFWNEGRAVITAKSLKEGAGAVVEAPPDPISPANEQKLIHLTGDVAVNDTTRDPIFFFGAPALRVVREVEMYQWKEETSTETHDKLGGGTTTTKNYTYTKAWSDKPVESAHFQHPEDHGNPPKLPIPAATTYCTQATLGAFNIPQAIIEKMSGDEPLPATAECLVHVPPDWQGKAKLSEDSIYLGNDPAVPAIGDARISFKILKPGTFSILAQQAGGTLAPYATHAGRMIELVESGAVSAEVMFQYALKKNTIITWAVRGGGFVLMLIGYILIFHPLKILADVVPFIGSIVGFGTEFIAFILAFAGSLIVIALAWLAARPLLGGTLLVIAVAALIHGIMRFRQHHAQRTAGAA
jgi:hypothetical protein